jgi:hypothetical protein
MSLLVCPLCGKSTSLRTFDPSNFEDDIVVKNVRGLGRGRGFEVTDTHSIIDDEEITRLIVNRALRIVALIRQHGHVTPEEILEALAIETIPRENVLLLEEGLRRMTGFRNQLLRKTNELLEANENLERTGKEREEQCSRKVAELENRMYLTQVFFLVALNKIHPDVLLVPLREVFSSERVQIATTLGEDPESVEVDSLSLNDVFKFVELSTNAPVDLAKLYNAFRHLGPRRLASLARLLRQITVLELLIPP